MPAEITALERPDAGRGAPKIVRRIPHGFVGSARRGAHRRVAVNRVPDVDEHDAVVAERAPALLERRDDCIDVRLRRRLQTELAGDAIVALLPVWRRRDDEIDGSVGQVHFRSRFALDAVVEFRQDRAVHQSTAPSVIRP